MPTTLRKSPSKSASKARVAVKASKPGKVASGGAKPAKLMPGKPAARAARSAKAPKSSLAQPSSVSIARAATKSARAGLTPAPARPAVPATPITRWAPESAPRQTTVKPARAPVSVKPTTVHLKVPGDAARSSEIIIGPGTLVNAPDHLLAPRSAVLIVIDSNVPGAAIEPLIKRLGTAGVRWQASVITASEPAKSLATAERVLADAAAFNLTRHDAIIAIGGGVVTDLAGFVASIYARGISIISCPTTLLAMVDASVGGKTGVNISIGRGQHSELLKNMAGTFHQPRRVVCDPLVLGSLPARQFAAGLAECIKHGLIGAEGGDRKLLAWIGANLAEILKRSPEVLGELITRNVKFKATVVARDERETKADLGVKGGRGVTSRASLAGRMALNLGHTFAHSFETLDGLSWRNADGALQAGPLLHGEAVALGLRCAAELSVRTLGLSKSVAEQLEQMLTAAGLPTRVSGLPDDATLLRRLSHDKKATNRGPRFIGLAPDGSAKLMSTVTQSTMAVCVDSIREP